MQSAACTGGSPAATFVSQSPPADGVRVRAAVDVTVTFRNCGSQTWNAVAADAPGGFKLGSAAPRDNTTWGSTRFALPADVPPAHQVTIPFTVTTPSLPGSHPFAFGIVHEGVAWLAQDGAVATVIVSAAGGTTTLCTGVTADASGATPATAALQQCVDATPDAGTLEIPAGLYLLDGQLVLPRAITLRTAGTSALASTCLLGADCAILRAAPLLDAASGMVHVTAPGGVVLDHLVFDGNRAARLGHAAATRCASGDNTHGANAVAANCAGCSFTRSATVRALCASGFIWVGDQATITDNLVQANGDHVTQNMWADGITLLRSTGAVVTGNRFDDNSDVDFIFGGGTAATVSGNTVRHAAQASFAGLMLDNFNNSTPGDFTGTTMSGNTVECGNHQCDFGIQLGPHPWYASTNILGGTVTGNTVRNAKQGINVAGAGTTGAPLVLYGNTVSGSTTSATFLCGTRTTSDVNIAPDSVVDRRGETGAVTTNPWNDCP